MIRLYVNQELNTESELLLDCDASHYLKHVLRQKEGDELHVFNGLPPYGFYVARIKSIQKRDIILSVANFVSQDTRSPLTIRLFQGISKAEKMDFTIQKSVELGVASIQPLWMEHTQVKLKDKERLNKKVQHWQKIACSAMEQSGQNALVSIEQPISFDNACQGLSTSALNIVLNPWTDKTINSIKSLIVKDINIFIGPEGGISQIELDTLKKYACQGIKLGPRILRTETASLAIISILQSLGGDF